MSSETQRETEDQVSKPVKALECQVPGCLADMDGVPKYNRMRQICLEHYTAPELLVCGRRMRWCQQCSKLHDLAQFDSNSRSCRDKLERHALLKRMRHKAKVTSRRAIPDAPNSQQQPQQVEEDEVEEQHMLHTVMVEKVFLEASTGVGKSRYLNLGQWQQAAQLQAWAQAQPPEQGHARAIALGSVTAADGPSPSSYQTHATPMPPQQLLSAAQRCDGLLHPLMTHGTDVVDLTGMKVDWEEHPQQTLCPVNVHRSSMPAQPCAVSSTQSALQQVPPPMQAQAFQPPMLTVPQMQTREPSMLSLGLSTFAQPHAHPAADVGLPQLLALPIHHTPAGSWHSPAAGSAGGWQASNANLDGASAWADVHPPPDVHMADGWASMPEVEMLEQAFYPGVAEDLENSPWQAFDSGSRPNSEHCFSFYDMSAASLESPSPRAQPWAVAGGQLEVELQGIMAGVLSHQASTFSKQAGLLSQHAGTLNLQPVSAPAAAADSAAGPYPADDPGRAAAPAAAGRGASAVFVGNPVQVTKSEGKSVGPEVQQYIPWPERECPGAVHVGLVPLQQPGDASGTAAHMPQLQSHHQQQDKQQLHVQQLQQQQQQQQSPGLFYGASQSPPMFSLMSEPMPRSRLSVRAVPEPSPMQDAFAGLCDIPGLTLQAHDAELHVLGNGRYCGGAYVRPASPMHSPHSTGHAAVPRVPAHAWRICRPARTPYGKGRLMLPEFPLLSLQPRGRGGRPVSDPWLDPAAPLREQVLSAEARPSSAADASRSPSPMYARQSVDAVQSVLGLQAAGAGLRGQQMAGGPMHAGTGRTNSMDLMHSMHSYGPLGSNLNLNLNLSQRAVSSSYAAEGSREPTDTTFITNTSSSSVAQPGVNMGMPSSPWLPNAGSQSPQYATAAAWVSWMPPGYAVRPIQHPILPGRAGCVGWAGQVPNGVLMSQVSDVSWTAGPEEGQPDHAPMESSEYVKPR